MSLPGRFRKRQQTPSLSTTWLIRLLCSLSTPPDERVAQQPGSCGLANPPAPPHWRRGLALSSHHYPVFWLLLKDLSLIRNGSTYNRKGNFCSRGAKSRRGKGTDTYRKPRTCQTQWSGEGEGCEGGRGEGLWVLDRQHGGTYGCRSVGRD